MLAPNLAHLAVTHVSMAATWILQEGGSVGWDPISLWRQMGILAKIVVVILFIMSGWSIGVMIDRARCDASDCVSHSRISCSHCAIGANYRL